MRANQCLERVENNKLRRHPDDVLPRRTLAVICHFFPASCSRYLLFAGCSTFLALAEPHATLTQRQVVHRASASVVRVMRDVSFKRAQTTLQCNPSVCILAVLGRRVVRRSRIHIEKTFRSGEALSPLVSRRHEQLTWSCPTSLLNSRRYR